MSNQSQWALFLLSNGELQFTKGFERFGPAPEPDTHLKYILVETGWGDDLKNNSWNHWQELKKEFSIEHYSSFFIMTKMEILEKKLENIVSKLKGL